MVMARVRIESIAAGGDGVGRSDGLAVFVPRTAPADLVDVDLDIRGRFARGALRSVVEASPARVQPACVHYERDRCGGCQLQHLADDAQRAAKSRIVRDAIERIGHRQIGDVAVVASPAQWHYRSKLTLAWRWLGDRWVAGLHAYDDPDHVFDLEVCPITREEIVATWADIRRVAHLLPRTRRLRASVRLADDGASLVVEGGTRWTTAAALADRVPVLRTVWWVAPGRPRRLMVDRRTPASAAPDASFAQVNAAASALLHAHVVDTVLRRSPSTVVDAYAGSGATAIPVAGRGVHVTAIELDADAARWTAERLPDGSRSLAARVEDVLATVLPADVVVLNPPRGGVDVRVTDTLRRVPPRAIIYVSCNPATLARDLARLDGFRIASVRAFDLFPQTSHVETVCELVPEGA